MEDESLPAKGEKQPQPQECQDEAAPAEACTVATNDEDRAAAETDLEETQEEPPVEPPVDADLAVPKNTNPDASHAQGKKVDITSVAAPLEKLVQEDCDRMAVEWRDLVDRKGTNGHVQDSPETGKDVKKYLGRSCGVLRGIETEEAILIQKQAGLPKPHPTNDDTAEDESIDILAQIQPLPLARFAGSSGGPQSVAGAYAISTAYPQAGPPQREFALRAEGFPPPVDAGRVEITSNSIPDASNELVEAHLVGEGEVVIAAEELNGCGVSKRISIICWGQLLLILALVATLTAVLVPKAKCNNSGLEFENKSEVKIETDTSGTTNPCVESTEELWGALDAYYKDSSPSANVSQTYGWPIGKWCVSKVNNFFKVFRPDRNGYSAANAKFHEDIGSWDMSNAHELEQTMRGCKNVSASWGIQNWDTQSIVNVQELFMATSWSEPALDLSRWNTSSMRNMGQLFRISDVAKANISSWDTSNVRSLSQFANGAKNFNDDLSNWDVSNVQTLNKAFEGAAFFNNDLSRWNTHSNLNLNNVFRSAASFNRDISQWRVGKVHQMNGAFAKGAFNQDISGWNVSSVTDAMWAFSGSSFNQSLCAWGSKLPTYANTTGMFQNTPCPNTSDPVIPGGPFCFNCDD